MTRMLQSTIAIFFLLAFLFLPYGAKAKVDWEVTDAVQLDEVPLDIARSQNNDLTFLLTDQAKVLIYSAADKIVGTIPVDPQMHPSFSLPVRRAGSPGRTRITRV